MYVDMDDLASFMGEHDEDEQYPKRERRNHEEINRDELADVISQEGAPALRRWGTTPHQVLPDRGFGDLDTELQELAVDARGAPGRVGVGHLADERVHVSRDAWPTRAHAADSSIASRAETLVGAI